MCGSSVELASDVLQLPDATKIPAAIAFECPSLRHRPVLQSASRERPAVDRCPRRGPADRRIGRPVDFVPSPGRRARPGGPQKPSARTSRHRLTCKDYLPVSQTGAMLFFQLINRRYERASTVLTSNKGFEEWGQILGDEVMAAALIDRLLHHCHIVNIRGSSYRMRKHIDLSKILHSPPAEPSPLPPKRKRARAKEKSTN